MDSCAEKRLLTVTPGNIRQSHLYVRGLEDFLPSDCVGPAKKARGAAEHEIEIHLDGLNEIVRTDIGVASANGKPRSFFRGRRWVRRFFEHHRVAAGDRLTLEKIADRSFRLSVHFRPDKNDRPKAAEFFAGIGLVRLALERQGWEVAFANDIDPAKGDYYFCKWSLTRLRSMSATCWH